MSGEYAMVRNTRYSRTVPITWMSVRIKDVDLYDEFHVLVFSKYKPIVCGSCGGGCIDAGFLPDDANMVEDWLREHGVEEEP